jgi:hypothetical protein
MSGKLRVNAGGALYYCNMSKCRDIAEDMGRWSSRVIVEREAVRRGFKSRPAWPAAAVE